MDMGINPNNVDSLNHAVPETPPLTYRLGPTARYHLLADGKPAMVLLFPLKVVVIQDIWRPLLEEIVEAGAMTLQQMAENMPHLRIDRIELFVNSLVMKGFLTQEGILYLQPDEYPSVSVIIPVRNRPVDIRACLSSLAQIDYPSEKLEIIVVDDASSDSTREVIGQFPGVRLIPQTEHRQVSFCRNMGAQQARGELLAFIDSDCTANPLWLKALVPAFRNPKIGAVGGLVDAACQDKGIDRYEMVKSSLKMGSWFKQSDLKERFFYVPSCNFLVRRKLYEKLGGFRESLHLGEDVDFCWRLQDLGLQLEYRPVGQVFHRHRNQMGPFFRRRFEYGTSEPLLQNLHPDRIKTLYFPVTESLFWLLAILSIWMPLLLIVCGGLWISTCLRGYRKLQKLKIAMGVGTVALSTTRSYLAFMYHCFSFISRYYLVAGLVLLPVMPLAGSLITAMHVITGLVDYGVRRPQLPLLPYLFYFSLDQIAYQSGVWWGCLRNQNFQPVFPGITHHQA
jgi:mycofactocin system glycosyltransferase